MRRLLLFFILTLAGLPLLAQSVTTVNGVKMQSPSLPFETARFPLLGNGNCVQTNLTDAALSTKGAPCPGAATAYRSILTFGTSYCEGTGATTWQDQGPAATGYCQRLLQKFGGNGTNFGQGSTQAAEIAYLMYLNSNPTETDNSAITVDVGFNDLNVYGVDPLKLSVFRQALEAGLAWASIPDVAKVAMDPTGPNCTTTGAWQPTPATGSGIHTRAVNIYYTTQAASTMTCRVTTWGKALYFVHQQVDGSPAGGGTIKIDGAVAVPYSNAPKAAIHTALGFGGALILERYVVPAGAHTVTVTHNIGSTYLAWLGSEGYYPFAAKVAPSTPPVVFVSDMFPPRGGQTLPNVTTYSNLIKSVVAELDGDGGNVYFVPVRDYLVMPQDYDGGTLPNGKNCPAPAFINGVNMAPNHPGDCGFLHIAEAFDAAMGIQQRGDQQMTHPTTAPTIGGPPSFGPDTGVQNTWVPYMPRTDANFTVQSVVPSTIPATNGLFFVVFGTPWRIMMNAADSGISETCVFSPGNSAAAGIQVWRYQSHVQNLVGLAAGPAGVPPGTYVFTVHCQQ